MTRPQLDFSAHDIIKYAASFWLPASNDGTTNRRSVLLLVGACGGRTLKTKCDNQLTGKTVVIGDRRQWITGDGEH
ncbi:MAG: hypothetical protein AB1586_09190 [Pseudomonadota bacterium]|jgi:hypothetical protein